MKGDELQKWSRDEINSLRLEATKKLSEYDASETKHKTMITEVRKKLVTAEVEISRTASELQNAKLTGVASSKHSSDQYEELHKTMESTKKRLYATMRQTQQEGESIKTTVDKPRKRGVVQQKASPKND